MHEPDRLLQSVRLLLVEDDPDSLFATADALEKRGMAVVRCGGGVEALDKFNPDELDAVASDIRLGDMNGMEVLAAVRKADPDFPVVLFTGYDDLESAAGAVRLRANDYLLKPLENIDELVSAVHGAVRNHRLIRANKKLSDEIVRKEELFRSILSSMDDVVLAFDAEGRITFHSRPQHGGLSWPKAPFLGRKHAEVMPPSVDKLFKAAFESVKGGCSAGYEFERKGGCGAEYWSVRISPMFHEALFSGAVAVARNITDRRMRENELAGEKENLRKLTLCLQIAEEKEKTRIASALHDNFISKLTLCLRRLDRIAMGGNDGPLAAQIEEMRSLADSAIEDVRMLLEDLSPVALHRDGLNAGLVELAGRMSERSGRHIAFTSVGTPRSLDGPVGTLLYRIAEELLVNAIKHADARDAAVHARWGDDGSVGITVEDRGGGFDLRDVDEGGGGGFGLFSIRERLRNIGGRMDAASSPGMGASVTVTVPGPARAGAGESGGGADEKDKGTGR